MHNPHPHGEKVMQVHQLKDHLSPRIKGVGKLPDANREDPMAHPYPNEFNPVPKEGRGMPHGKRVEPDAFEK